MAVMVYGGAGSGGGWVDITDDVVLGSGKEFRLPQSNSDARIVDNANGAYVLIEDVEYKDRYRITGWISGASGTALTDMVAVFLDVNDTVLAASGRRVLGSETSYDAYGNPLSTKYTDLSKKTYAPIEVAIPKMSGVAKLMVVHGAIKAGSTYDDVIVEKWIG